MAATETPEAMTDEGRALMTDTERRIISGEKEVSDNYRYKVESLVRNRVRKKFGDDVDVLREDFSEVYEMLEGEVCDGVVDDDLDPALAREALEEARIHLENLNRDKLTDALDELDDALGVERDG